MPYRVPHPVDFDVHSLSGPDSAQSLEVPDQTPQVQNQISPSFLYHSTGPCCVKDCVPCIFHLLL
jgi:hypothetical protein